MPLRNRFRQRAALFCHEQPGLDQRVRPAAVDLIGRTSILD
jgi:hypothetical protein